MSQRADPSDRFDVEAVKDLSQNLGVWREETASHSSTLINFFMCIYSCDSFAYMQWLCHPRGALGLETPSGRLNLEGPRKAALWPLSIGSACCCV